MVDGFIAAGHTIAGCARREEPLQIMRGQYGAPHRFMQCDVSEPAQVKAFAETVLDDLGPPDLLINNASILNKPAPLWKMPAEDTARLVDINIKGPIAIIQAFVPAMVEAKRGIIINLSSGWGRMTSPEVAAYCASKFAMEGLSQSLAQELPDGMACIALNPGIINTEMLRGAFGKNAESHISPEEWGKKAIPKILGFTAKDNGKGRTI